MAQQVDYRLLGSALARVRWELDINPRWNRDPNFYLEQTLTAVAEALTVPAPYDAARSSEILTRLENIPSIIQSAQENLRNPPAPFATVAIQALSDIRPHLGKMAEALLPHTTLQAAELESATNLADDALEKFRGFLQERLPSLPQQTALGRDAYVFFLKDVALYPYSPEEILAMGRQEWNRAVAFETYERERNRDVPPLKLAQNTDTWIKDAAAKEQQVRDFLEKAQHPDRLRLGPALHLAADSGVSARDRVRRERRLHFTFTPEGELCPLCERAYRRAWLFLACHGAGPAPDHRPRRHPRALLAALPFLEKRKSDAQALLRLRRERRDRILR